MAKNNHSIGNAGEFYVLAQLAQRGYIAGKTDDGQTLINVIATDPETFRPALIRLFLRVSRLRIRSSAGREPKGSEQTSVDLFVQLFAEPSRETAFPR